VVANARASASANWHPGAVVGAIYYVFVHNGTAADPNAGLWFGNGYSYADGVGCPTGAVCNGGNGGSLAGSGGDGYNSGNGGRAGLFLGGSLSIAGNGGAAAAGCVGATCDGGNGGSSGLLGIGGSGGAGFGTGTGGAGGRGGLISGTGGVGGEGGALGGSGGLGGSAVLFGTGGVGGAGGAGGTGSVWFGTGGAGGSGGDGGGGGAGGIGADDPFTGGTGGSGGAGGDGGTGGEGGEGAYGGTGGNAGQGGTGGNAGGGGAAQTVSRSTFGGGGATGGVGGNAGAAGNGGGGRFGNVGTAGDGANGGDGGDGGVGGSGGPVGSPGVNGTGGTGGTGVINGIDGTPLAENKTIGITTYYADGIYPYPIVNVSVNGGTPHPVLLDTGSTGLVIDWVPEGLGTSVYSGGPFTYGSSDSMYYDTYDTTVSFGNGIVTASTGVDVLTPESALVFQRYWGTRHPGPIGVPIDGVLGIGPSDDYPGTSTVVSALPGTLNQGVLIDGSSNLITFGPNLQTGTEVDGAPKATLQVQINGGEKVVVPGAFIDSGYNNGYFGSLVYTGPTTPAGKVPAGTEIAVYNSDGELLYSYTTTERNGPEVFTGYDLNTGFTPFMLAPIYVGQAPSSIGTTIFTA